MIKFLKNLISKIKYNISHDRCYDTMEERGIAASGLCGGIVGGSKATGYLSEGCIGCPYWTPREV